MNKLEEAMSNLNNIQENINILMYAIGDAPRQYTEDELLNMLIGMSQLHQTLYDKLWVEYQNDRRKNKLLDEDDMFGQNHMEAKQGK